MKYSQDYIYKQDASYIGMDNKKILIYGAGSLGSFLGAKLNRAGHEVDLIGRKKAKSIGNKLYINGEKYDFPKVYDDLNPSKYYNYVIITSKYFDLKKNLEELNNSGVRYDTIVLIQNTYFDNLWYYHLIKDKPMVIISVVEGFNLTDNQLKFVEYAGWFVEDDILGKDVYVLLKNAGINVTLTDEINTKRAEKTIYNCALNLFSAYHEKTFKELVSDREYMTEIKNVFEESYDVMSEIVALKSKRSLWKTCSSIMKNMDHYSSTYQDVKQNKKTELSFLNGFVIDLGKKMDIETPYNVEAVKNFKKKYPNLY